MVINSITKVPVMKFVLLMVLHYVIMNTIATNHGSSGLSPMPVPYNPNCQRKQKVRKAKKTWI